MTLILFSHRFAIAFGKCFASSPKQRRSLKDIIMYYVKQVARLPAWALP
ncbi:MAG: hypothetical protein V7K33_28470 [Nostoc sp.]